MAAIRPSATGAVLALVERLRAEGRELISLGAGEPDFDTPQHVREAAVAAIEAGQTRYTPIGGSDALKAAIQRKFARENGLDYAPSQIIVTSGAKQALCNLCLAILDPGDEAIVPAPYWVSYPEMVRLAEATPVVITTGMEQHFKITPGQLERAITERTRLLFINSPSNPTGAAYTRAELEALGQVLERHPRIVIVSDEIYEHISWGDEAIVSFATACPTLVDRTVTVNGVSKAYAMTGWRIGYAGGPRALIDAMTTIQSQSTSNACTISQAASIAALDGDQACVARMAAAYKARHDYVVDALNGLPGVSCRHGEGSFYAFPSVNGVLDSHGLRTDHELVAFLLEKAHVACVAGSAFGAPGHLRISFACSMETLRKAIENMKRALTA